MQKLAVVSYRPSVCAHAGGPKIWWTPGPRPLGWGVDDPLEMRTFPRVTIPNLVVL